MTPPSVGRVVHFYPPVDEPKPDRGDGPYAAIVTEVVYAEDGRMPVNFPVHLISFGRGSLYFHEDVPYVENEEAGDTRGACWTWPPRVS